MGMGTEEVDIPARPPQQQSQAAAQQGRHPVQRREGGGLSLSLPLHLAASGGSSAAKGGAAAALPAQAAANGGAAQAAGSGGADRHGHGHGRDDCWSEGATNTLIEAWGDRYLELNRGNLKQKHWKDVADAVSRRGECAAKPPKTDVQCKNRLDTLKKKYKLEKGKIFSGGAPSKWPFFNKLDELIGPSRKHQSNGNGNGNNGAKGVPGARAAAAGKEIRTSDEAQAQLRVMMMMSGHNNQNERNNSGSSKSDETPDTTDSCPDGLDVAVKKRKATAPDDARAHGPFRELTRAVVKFGEVYERVERSKQQQLMDLEKQRMEFIKELEIQRMQLFMQTQLELAKLKHAKHGNTEHYL